MEALWLRQEGNEQSKCVQRVFIFLCWINVSLDKHTLWVTYLRASAPGNLLVPVTVFIKASWCLVYSFIFISN